MASDTQRIIAGRGPSKTLSVLTGRLLYSPKLFFYLAAGQARDSGGVGSKAEEVYRETCLAWKFLWRAGRGLVVDVGR